MNPRPHAYSTWRMLLAGVLVCNLAWTAMAQTPAPVYRVGYPDTSEGRQYLPLLTQACRQLTARLNAGTFKPEALPGSSDGQPLARCEFYLLDPAVLLREPSLRNAALLAVAGFQYNEAPYQQLGGVLFCLNERTDLQRLPDLRGRILAAARSDSLAGWLALSRECRVRLFDPASACRSVVFTGDELEVVKRVISGAADAGVVPAGILEQYCEQYQYDGKNLRVVAFKNPADEHFSGPYPLLISTRLYPAWLWAAPAFTDPHLARQVAAQLMGMPPLPADPARPAAVTWHPPASLEEVDACLRELVMSAFNQQAEQEWRAFYARHRGLLIEVGVALALVLLLAAVLLAYVIRLRVSRQRLWRGLSVQYARLARQVQAESMAGLWVWECDPEGRLVYCSPSVQDLLGYAPDDLCGRALVALFSALEPRRHATLPRILSEHMGKWFRQPVLLRTADGRVVLHEISASTMLDERSKVLCYMGITRDITHEAGHIFIGSREVS